MAKGQKDASTLYQHYNSYFIAITPFFLELIAITLSYCFHIYFVIRLTTKFCSF